MHHRVNIKVQREIGVVVVSKPEDFVSFLETNSQSLCS